MLTKLLNRYLNFKKREEEKLEELEGYLATISDAQHINKIFKPSGVVNVALMLAKLEDDKKLYFLE